MSVVQPDHVSSLRLNIPSSKSKGVKVREIMANPAGPRPIGARIQTLLGESVTIFNVIDGVLNN